jgi:hypothetical protein
MIEPGENPERINRKSWIFVILGIILLGILFLVGFGLYIRILVQNTTDRIVGPFEAANQTLKTEVFELLNPTPTIIPDPVTIVHEIRSLARLETIQYTVEKVITAETGQGAFGFLFGDRLLFVAHGYVIAGVDLAKLESHDLRLEDNILYVTLPNPEVFVATLDNSKSYVYDRQMGMLTQGDQSLETNARQVAEQTITQAAMDDGILDQAKINAENYLSRLFQDLGYEDVIFDYATPAP